MKFWTLLFIVCLEILSNAPRANEPAETKTLETKLATIDADQFALDKDENKSVDHGLVKSIRQQLLNDNALSNSAKNIQIIVVEKEITLKGPVSSERDQRKILETVKKASNDHKIRNQLEIIRE